MNALTSEQIREAHKALRALRAEGYANCICGDPVDHHAHSKGRCLMACGCKQATWASMIVVEKLLESCWIIPRSAPTITIARSTPVSPSLAADSGDKPAGLYARVEP